MMAALSGAPDDTTGLPCEFLGVKGCSFPPDLRPFGCTTYLCPFMYRLLDRRTLARMKRLVRELEDRHAELMSRIHRRTSEQAEE